MHLKPGAREQRFCFGECNTKGFEDSRPMCRTELKQREWRLRWAEKAGTGFTLPSHQQAAAETPNGKSGKILEFRKVG